MELRCSKDKELEDLKEEMQKFRNEYGLLLIKVQNRESDVVEKENSISLREKKLKEKIAELDELKSKIQLELQMAQAKGQTYDNQFQQFAKEKERVYRDKAEITAKLNQAETLFDDVKNRELNIQETMNENKKLMKKYDSLEANFVDREKALKEERKELDKIREQLKSDAEANKIDAESNRTKKKELDTLEKKIKGNK